MQIVEPTDDMIRAWLQEECRLHSTSIVQKPSDPGTRYVYFEKQCIATFDVTKYHEQMIAWANQQHRAIPNYSVA